MVRGIASRYAEVHFRKHYMHMAIDQAQHEHPSLQSITSAFVVLIDLPETSRIDSPSTRTETPPSSASA